MPSPSRQCEGVITGISSRSLDNFFGTRILTSWLSNQYKFYQYFSKGKQRRILLSKKKRPFSLKKSTGLLPSFFYFYLTVFLQEKILLYWRFCLRLVATIGNQTIYYKAIISDVKIQALSSYFYSIWNKCILVSLQLICIAF